MRAPPIRSASDIIQNCEVTGFEHRERPRVGDRDQPRPHRARTGSGWRSPAIPRVLAGMAGFALPMQLYTLQAMVSEPVKPCLDTVVLHLGTAPMSASPTRASW